MTKRGSFALDIQISYNGPKEVAHANDTFFIKRLDDQESLETGKFRGEILGVKGQDFVAIFPHKVYGMLRKFGFRPRSVLIQWRAQGVIQVSGGKKGKDDKFTYPVRIGGKQLRMIKIVSLDSVAKGEGVDSL